MANIIKARLGSIARFQQGVQVDVGEQRFVASPDAVRFLRIVDYTDEKVPPRYIKGTQASRSYVTDTDVAMIRYGSQTAGRPVIGKSGIIANNIFRIIPNQGAEIDKKYLYYFLNTAQVRSYLMDGQNSSTMPAITFGMIGDLDIYLHPLSRQRGIAAVLSALDDKIEFNRKINAELEQMARTLYDYWFVQFDFPDASGKPYKSSDGAMKFSPELNRDIPEGWQVQNMLENDLFEVIKPRIDDFKGEKQYIATADVNGLNISDGSPITYENRESRANMQPKAFTVWFAKMKNSIKHVLVGDYSNDLIEKTIFSTGFMGLQTNREAFEYVALTVHRPYFELVKDSNSSGATMEAIGNSAMANMKLIIPDDRTLKMFYEVARPLLEKIDKNRQESQNLAHLRDWLLPMLMNGQVRVG